MLAASDKNSAPKPPTSSSTQTPARALPELPPVFDRRPLRPVELLRKPSRLLTAISIRKKLILLHTIFTVLLALALLVTVRPAVNAIVRDAELDKAAALLELAVRDPNATSAGYQPLAIPGFTLRFATGSPRALALDQPTLGRMLKRPGTAIHRPDGLGVAAAFPDAPAGETCACLDVTNHAARARVARLSSFLIGALLAIYLLIAAALELFVLPENVYRPIRRLLVADAASRAGDRSGELIPANAIPADEIGQIMTSRNETLTKLREHERDLAAALTDLERVAADLKVKNHLLETARRNLADADRLAGLGMMSAGIAHEINTPLAVVKGLAERLQSRPGHELTPEESRLMHRVVTRLERLSESLLDYARARPSQARATPLRTLAEEAIQLVKLDRAGERVRTTLDVPPEMNAFCDGDRILQVFVNLLRNAFDALGAHPSEPTVNFSARTLERDGRAFVAVSIADNGPGISPEILPRLFEPFASTRLDARGTGLGLAVSEGIVREHGGVLVARNRSDTPGAVFEVLLPAPADATIRASARQESPD